METIKITNINSVYDNIRYINEEVNRDIRFHIREVVSILKEEEIKKYKNSSLSSIEEKILLQS